ncbi:MAG: hypothetical protein II816_03740 [Elusimicrobia bacterium]|nr:hypothetical protein [Elusimicrobiota bacterium]
MKDLGVVHGSGLQAKPVIYSDDTVYVHTDIKQLEEYGGEPVQDFFEYHEYQYDVQEWFELIGDENSSLKADLLDTQEQLTDTQLALVEVYELIGG